MIVLLATSSGCRPPETRLEILSFKDAQGSNQFSERFEAGAFAVDAQNNWDITFDMPAAMARVDSPMGRTPTTTSKSAESATNDQEEVPISQMIHVHVFWRPVPGTTFAESSQTNATIVYCLTMGRNTIAYRGAGFVYFTPSRDGSTIEGRIESSDLVPTDYVNEPVDLFGPCRIEGTFVAHENRRKVVDVIQRLRKCIGPPGRSAKDVGGLREP